MSRKEITDLQVVEACAEFHGPSGRLGRAPWVLLVERTGQPEKVVYAAMERAYNRDLIEYGMSLRTAWPTSKGLALLPPRETER